MYKKRKPLIRPLLLTLILLVLLSSPAAAAVSGFVAGDDDGILYEYSYDDLLDSYALKILGSPNGLYGDFAAKKTFSILSSAGRYIDYNDLLDSYASALIIKEKFDLEKYLDSKETKTAQMPSTIRVVKLSSGKIVYNTKTITSDPVGSNPDFKPPKTKTPITGLAEMSVEQVQAWAKSREAHQRFVDIAPLYWEYGKKTGIRPEVLYAQAAVETNFGKYGNRVPPEYNNWAGIKIAEADGDSTEDHEKFSTPEEGVRAHFNHISAYVGLKPLGEPHDRYHVAAGQPWAGSVLFVEDLSGKWAPSLDYHIYILIFLGQLAGQKVTESNPNPDEEASPEPKPDNPSEKHVVVDVNILRLRSGPGTDYDILDRLALGTVLKVTGNQNEWLEVVTPEGKNGWVHGDYVKEVTMSDSSLKDKTIVVDPGHGGSDPGATGVTGLREKVINLAVAKNLVTLLEEAGANVIMTRSGDQSVSNQMRVELANESKADIYISIHANASPDPESNGTETHYCSENGNSSAGRFLAGQLQLELVSALGFRDRGVKTNSFYVLTKTEMPAALVELGFLSNPEEEELLKKEQTQSKAAIALYQGLEAYFLYYR